MRPYALRLAVDGPDPVLEREGVVGAVAVWRLGLERLLYQSQDFPISTEREHVGGKFLADSPFAVENENLVDIEIPVGVGANLDGEVDAVKPYFDHSMSSAPIRIDKVQQRIMAANSFMVVILFEL